MMNGLDETAFTQPHRTDEYMTLAEVKAIGVGQSCFQCNEMRTAGDCDMSHGRCSNCVYYCKPNTECEPSTKSFEYHLYNQAASAEDKKLRQPRARKRPNREPPGYGLRPNGPAKLLPPELINEPLKYLQPTPRYAKEIEEKQVAQMQQEDKTIREADGTSSAAGAMSRSSVAGSSNLSSDFSCPLPTPMLAIAPSSCVSSSHHMSDAYSTPVPSSMHGISCRTALPHSTSPLRMPGPAYPYFSSSTPGACSTYNASSTPGPYHAPNGRHGSSGVPTVYDAVSPRGGSSFGNKNGPYSKPPPAMPVYDDHPHMASQNVQYQWRKAQIAAQVAAPVAAPLPSTRAPLQ